MVGSRQLPVHLLAPYVAAAADEMAEAGTLSDRSLRAVEEAALQLEAEEAALGGMAALSRPVG